MSVEALKQTIAVARGVLENTSKEQLSQSTPCAEWDVSGLINHMVGAHYFFEMGLTGKPSGDMTTDFAAGDFLSAYDDAANACVAAFSADGVMEKMHKPPFGEMPGSAVVGLAMTDTFTHAWDLAKATGQNTDLAPQTAEVLLAGARQSIQPGFRSEEGSVFGLEKTAPAGASKADELAAFLGRDVS